MIKQSLEILIPSYNEEKNIETVVEKSLAWLKSQTEDYSVLVVEDGSNDKTKEILKNLTKKDSHLKTIYHKKNLGIGQSWYDLYKNASKNIIFTCPADQQFDPADFSIAIPYIDKADIISIYRLKKQGYNLFRLILTNTNKLLVRILFRLNIKDINWVKMYKKELLNQLNIQLKSSLLETEILAKAKKRHAKIIQLQAPYHLRIHGKARGASFKNLWLVFIDLIKLYLSVRIFK